MKRLSLLLATLLATATVHAKLPAPSDEAKAKAAEAAAKTAHGGKLDGYKLCLSMNKVAERYHGEAKKAGRPASAPSETPACADPGPFVYVPAGAAAAPAAAPAPAATAAATPAKK
ncbi:MAG: hypothetical protein KBC73_06805 [Burkholderiaceae bacterium]|nr:hypothetical protein [Burkholderiaceae bacterium]